MAFVAVVSAGTTGLVSGTLRISAWDHRIDSTDAATKDLVRRVDALDIDRQERDTRRIRLADDLAAVNKRIDVNNTRLNAIDSRFQTIDNWMADAQTRREAYKVTLGGIDSKIAVLDAQMLWMSGFIRDNVGLVPHAGGRK